MGRSESVRGPEYGVSGGWEERSPRAVIPGTSLRFAPAALSIALNSEFKLLYGAPCFPVGVNGDPQLSSRLKRFVECVEKRPS